MKKIFVCSPLSGDVEANKEKARKYCKFVTGQGHAPFAPHLLYTQWLDESKEDQRNLGMEMGYKFLVVCDEVWVFERKDDERSVGVAKEIKVAKELNKLVLIIDPGDIDE